MVFVNGDKTMTFSDNFFDEAYYYSLHYPLSFMEVDSGVLTKFENGEFTAEVELPGIDPSTVSVNRNGMDITIEGIRNETPIRRSVTLNQFCDTDTVEAKLSNGLLVITARQTTGENRTIPVKFK